MWVCACLFVFARAQVQVHVRAWVRGCGRKCAYLYVCTSAVLITVCVVTNALNAFIITQLALLFVHLSIEDGMRGESSWNLTASSARERAHCDVWGTGDMSGNQRRE